MINIVTSNDAAASTIGAIGGTAAGAGQAFNGLTAAGAGRRSELAGTRANLVAQYNNVLTQITTTSQDGSFNGINLLNGDTLKLTFNENGDRPSASAASPSTPPASVSLPSQPAPTSWTTTPPTRSSSRVNAASTTLRSEASTLGSNLSMVQIRQDFPKNLIDVLLTGSSNLTLAEPKEAANSQALSTRQSIAVSALALANQSQQSVLQLLR